MPDCYPAVGFELLSTEEMYSADRLAVASGTPGFQLMEAAGLAVTQIIMARYPRAFNAAGRVSVLCGPGNNGGDGFVVARQLAKAGWAVQLGLLGDRGELKGDAGKHAALWQGDVGVLEEAMLEDCDLVVDALFGAGLTRPLDGQVRGHVARLNERKVPVVSVDVPSGLSGDTGQVLGDIAVQAMETVTFFRRKPGHLLYPGRGYCGEVFVRDIGISPSVLAQIEPKTWSNGPALWRAAIPRRDANSHKYHFGYALLSAGDRLVGASLLAARAAQRAGAGLVTVACSDHSWPVIAAALPSVMTQALDQQATFQDLLSDHRVTAVLLGPGQGVGASTREGVLAAISAKKSLVIDADALTSFGADPDYLFEAIKAAGGVRAVLTPHDGEFARLFPDLSGDRLCRARAAATRAGAVVLLKGADSVIAAPDGRAAINENAPPDLAVAGSGDVLAGLTVGMLAQGMAPFEAACAATWLHGEAGTIAGRGLIPEDLIQSLPQVLKQLFNVPKKLSQ
ncbi:MAG: NAD(P)H-hydrate dehydratase [Pseudomonadota bacterium]